MGYRRYTSVKRSARPIRMARIPPDDERFHTITISTGKGQEIFLDYFRLKGVTSIDISMMSGDVPRITIQMLAADVFYRAPEKD
jgi:hypothetical protein